MKRITHIDGGSELLERVHAATSVEDWSHILKDHISAGNSKVSDRTAIFNLNSAHDCPNRETHAADDGEGPVGQCQVEWSQCYAQKSETMYPSVKPYRQRQEYLWDIMTPELWAKAFNSLNSRKRTPFNAIRINEAGDFRSEADIIRMNEVAKNVDVPVYTYTASFKLDWSLATEFTVNASGRTMQHADRTFAAIDADSDMPEGYVQCPNDAQKQTGSSDPIKCGECRLCINSDGPDVAIRLH